MSLPAQISNWPASWRELFAERAAIMEFDALLPRDQAELLAESETRRTADEEWESPRRTA
jgi:hypothetical protein